MPRRPATHAQESKRVPKWHKGVRTSFPRPPPPSLPPALGISPRARRGTPRPGLSTAARRRAQVSSRAPTQRQIPGPLVFPTPPRWGDTPSPTAGAERTCPSPPRGGASPLAPPPSPAPPRREAGGAPDRGQAPARLRTCSRRGRARGRKWGGWRRRSRRRWPPWASSSTPASWSPPRYSAAARRGFPTPWRGEEERGGGWDGSRRGLPRSSPLRKRPLGVREGGACGRACAEPRGGLREQRRRRWGTRSGVNSNGVAALLPPSPRCPGPLGLARLSGGNGSAACMRLAVRCSAAKAGIKSPPRRCTFRGVWGCRCASLWPPALFYRPGSYCRRR